MFKYIFLVMLSIPSITLAEGLNPFAEGVRQAEEEQRMWQERNQFNAAVSAYQHEKRQDRLYGNRETVIRIEPNPFAEALSRPLTGTFGSEGPTTQYGRGRWMPTR